MDGFFNAMSASLVLLMLMSVGYFMGARGWMNASEKKFISKYIVNIAVPCNCLTGLLNNLDHDSLLEAGIMVAAALLGSWTVLAYLPYLVVAGAASGLFTGLCAQLLVGRLKGLDHG